MSRENMSITAIGPKDLLIYLCLRRYRNPNTGESSVPVKTLVKESGASPVTVLNSLQRLEESGYITYKKHGRANIYKFCIHIEAKSYLFLDTNRTYSEKVQDAVNMAYIPEAKNTDEADVDLERLYDYIGQLEERIVQMSAQNRTIVAELNKVNRYVSVIAGQAYSPINFDDDAALT